MRTFVRLPKEQNKVLCRSLGHLIIEIVFSQSWNASPYLGFVLRNFKFLMVKRLMRLALDIVKYLFILRSFSTQ